jgi:FMN reductase
VSATVVGLVGNPRAESRTHQLARGLCAALAEHLPGSASVEVDLAPFGPRVLDPADGEVDAALAQVLGANVLVLASPTYKGTYSGLLKAFLDRAGHRALEGVGAVPILLGGAPDHSLAIDVHFTPLLLELGASVPVRGLFVLESDVDRFETTARQWVASQGAPLLGLASAGPVALA